MTHSEMIGLVLWFFIFYPVWSPRMRRIRKHQRLVAAGLAGEGPKWEQDEPFPECFEEDDL